MGKVMNIVAKEYGKEINTIKDLFIATYYFYPISARWQWECILDECLKEAISEGKITSEQSEKIHKKVLDEYEREVREVLEA